MAAIHPDMNKDKYLPKYLSRRNYRDESQHRYFVLKDGYPKKINDEYSALAKEPKHVMAVGVGFNPAGRRRRGAQSE